MIFKTVRELKNKVFKTSIIRIAKQDDPCAEAEARLEDDFGAVSIEAGGKFEAAISKKDNKFEIEYDLETAVSKDVFKFAIDSKKIELLPSVIITYSCDSEKETIRKYTDLVLSPLEAAELKCRIFETVIESRIEAAIDEWKLQQTNFEEEEIEVFEKCLIK